MSAWYEDFFDGLAVDFWLAAAPPPTAEVEFVQSVIGAPRGQELLDVPCGAGRHTIALAQAGYRMTGVDLSPTFLSRARDASSGLAIEWRESDMRDLPWNARFDAALCLGNSFGYLGRPGMREFVAAVARTLKPGAPFVLDTSAVAESVLPALQERRWMQFGDITFLSAATYHADESRLDVEYTFMRGAQRETKTAQTSIYTAAELRELLQNAGLTVEAMYGSFAREPYRVGSIRLVVVARSPLSRER